MSLIIELDPAVEAQLRRDAERQGTGPEELARQMIEQHVKPRLAGQSLWETLSPEAWARKTREWAESHRDWPVLPPEATERTSFYEDERL